MANFYLVEQRGVPGARLIEAERPASAVNHVTEGAFTVKRVDGRELLDAAKLYEVEVAGAKPANEPAATATAQAATAEEPATMANTLADAADDEEPETVEQEPWLTPDEEAETVEDVD